MRKWYKIIAVFVVLGGIAGVLGYHYVYNKSHMDYEKAEPDFHMTGDGLFDHYTTNKAEAQQTYNGKVLEVAGRVSSVENPDSLTIVVFAMREGMFGDEGIRFSMLQDYSASANELNAGDPVTIKGYCTGYNDTDIILENCSIIR